MSTYQSTIIIGHLGADPESRQVGDTTVCNIRLATSERWKDKQTGEMQEQTEWHRANLWGRTAEIAQQYLKKGSLCLVEGRLQTRKYLKDGVDHYSTELRVDRLKLMGNANEGAKDDKRGDWQTGQAEYAQASGGTQAARRQPVAAGADGPEDNIPF